MSGLSESDRFFIFRYIGIKSFHQPARTSTQIMNTWLKSQLKIQFDRAVRSGWLSHFVEAAKTHTTSFFDAADLMGIGSRETNLDAKWLTKAGDGGHGYGLLQADVGSFPEWIKSGKWRDAREGILMGALILMQKWRDIEKCTGQRVSVRSSRTGTIFTFIAKRLAGAERQKVTIASYNAGRWAHYAVSKGLNADKYTTGGDYSADVIARAEFFRPLVKKWMEENGLTDEQPNDVKPAQTAPIEQETSLQPPDSQNVELPMGEPVTENSNLPEDSENNLQDMISHNVSPENAKSFLARVWRVLIRPLGLLYAALQAGNVYAWLGVVVFAAGVGLTLYWHRTDIKNLFAKLQDKFYKSFV
jgi:hypothetical protein